MFKKVLGVPIILPWSASIALSIFEEESHECVGSGVDAVHGNEDFGSVIERLPMYDYGYILLFTLKTCTSTQY